MCEKLKLNFTEENIDSRYTAIVKKLDEIGDPNYPSLLVVDNAEVDLGDPNIALPDSKKWKILGTSRQSINNFYELELDKLLPEEAHELFMLYYPVKGEEEFKILDQILKYIDYHPLAIECSAKSLAEGYSDLKEFYDNLTNFKLDHEDSYFRSEYSNQEASLLQHLLAIFYGHLFSEEEKTLLIQLALMPSTDLPFAHLKVLLAGKVGLEKVMTKLARLGWISIVSNTNTQEKSIRLHRLIKELIKYQFSKDEKTETYDINLLWEPAKQVIQNLINNLEGANAFQYLIFYFEIKRIFSKDKVFDKELGNLHLKWRNAYDLFLITFNIASQKEYDFFEQVLALYPEELMVYFGLGHYFSSHKKWDESIVAYQKAIELDPEFAGAYYKLGTAHQAKGDFDNAIHAFQKVIELNPQDSNTWNILGWVQILQNQLGEAKQSSLNAWQLSDEKEYTPAMNLGHIELFSENHNEAMIWYLKSVNLAEDKEEFFQGMEADYHDLKMEERGISRESYTGILAQLRLSIGS